MKWIRRFLVVGGLVTVAVAAPSLVPEQPIHVQLQGKTAAEKAQIKTEKIVKLRLTGSFVDPIHDTTITISDISRIDAGIEMLIRAWRPNGEPIGFGDGTIETERVRMISPPILVDDPQGDITRNFEDRQGNQRQRKLREDPVQAVRERLAHVVYIVGKDGSRIVPGSVGHTTTTCNPDPDPESTSVDGFVFRLSDNSTWADMHDGAGTHAIPSALIGEIEIQDGTTDNTYRNIVRNPLLFDCSAIPDTDTVTSATVSLYGSSKTDALSITPTISIYTSTPASNTNLVTGDYNIASWGSTALANTISYASWSTTGYNDFTMTDLTVISKTAVSKLGAREAAYDGANSPATTTNNGAPNSSIIEWIGADETGTSTDPLLTVVSGVAAAGRRPFIPQPILE